MNREAEELADRAETEKNISRITELNSMRTRTLEFQHNMEGSVSKIQKLQDQPIKNVTFKQINEHVKLISLY